MYETMKVQISRKPYDKYGVKKHNCVSTEKEKKVGNK